MLVSPIFQTWSKFCTLDGGSMAWCLIVLPTTDVCDYLLQLRTIGEQCPGSAKLVLAWLYKGHKRLLFQRLVLPITRLLHRCVPSHSLTPREKSNWRKVEPFISPFFLYLSNIFLKGGGEVERWKSELVEQAFHFSDLGAKVHPCLQFFSTPIL